MSLMHTNMSSAGGKGRVFKRLDRNSISSLMICIVSLAMIVDLAQIHNALGSYDIRLWQILVLLVAPFVVISGKAFLPKSMIVILGVLMVHTTIILMVTHIIPWPSFVQIGLLFVFSVIIYSFIRKVGLAVISEMYLRVGKIVSYSILIESAIYIAAPEFANITIYSVINHFSGPWIFTRAHGLMMEPSQVALVLPPAMFLCLCNKNLRLFSLFGFSSILTFSMLTYIGMLIALAIYFIIKNGIPIYKFIALSVILIAVTAFVPPIQSRVKAIAKIPHYLENSSAIGVQDAFNNMGGSVGSMAIALRVAKIGFNSNYMLGEGFGSFDIAGTRFAGNIDENKLSNYRASTHLFGKLGTGGSVVIRILGELGAFGLVFIIFTIIVLIKMIRRCRRLYLSDKHVFLEPYFQVIGMFLVLLLTYIIRKDGYINIYFLVPLMACMVGYRSMSCIKSD